MECNRDKALRAKVIAEEKFVANNIAGAKKFALIAKEIYPGLEGLPEMLATIDVHLSAAENTTDGEADWYRILGVHPYVDDETLEKQYTKLAQLLHPDTNISVGADGAWKLISEAWDVLSDKKKRLTYNYKKMVSHRSTSSNISSGCSSTSSVKVSPTESTASSSSDIPRKTSASSSGIKRGTFFTMCHSCKMQYEYVVMYKNRNLSCPNCHEAFVAVEVPRRP